MFEVECAYRQADGALNFLHDSDATDDDALAVLRVTFAVRRIFPPEPDTGAGMDWDGDVSTIEMRQVGDYSPRFSRWIVLRDAQHAAALEFLLRVHGRALWESGDEAAEALFYGEAA